MTSELQLVDDNHVIKGPNFPYTQEISLGRHLMDCLNKYGDLVSQIYAPTGEKRTFTDIKIESIKIATNLRKVLGIQENDVLSICSPNNSYTSQVLVAGLFIGAIISPLDPALSKSEIRHLLSITKPKLIFAAVSCLRTIENVIKELEVPAKIVVIGHTDKYTTVHQLLKGDCDLDFNPIDFKNPHDHIAFLMSSSGTTGLPKCVEVTHGALMMQTQLIWSMQLQGIKLLNMSTLFWISGVIVALLAIDRGVIRILTSPFNPTEALQNIEKYEINWLVTGVTYFCRIVTHPTAEKYELNTMKILSIGGGKVSRFHQNLGNKLFKNANISSAFGMTETAGQCFQLNSGKPGSIGFIMPGCEVKVRDLETNQSLGPNKVGELCLRGKLCFKRYHNNPEGTAQTIDNDNWIRTGDLGYYDDDKCFYIQGRLKEQFKSKGWALSCLELETALLDHPDVLEAAVIGVPHAVDVARPRAFLVKRENSDVGEGDINKYMIEKLSVHKQITGGVVFMEALPVTPTGKIQKCTLMDLVNTEE